MHSQPTISKVFAKLFNVAGGSKTMPQNLHFRKKEARATKIVDTVCIGR
jgi:hypothetical protein